MHKKVQMNVQAEPTNYTLRLRRERTDDGDVDVYCKEDGDGKVEDLVDAAPAHLPLTLNGKH
jgi:hypothetical protein